MGETEKGKPVFRTATPKKAVKSHTADAGDWDWLEEEAERRGISRSAFLRLVLREARAGKTAVPKILRGGCRIVHLVDINPIEGKLYLTASGLYPTDGGAPFSVPHDAEGKTSEFIEKGPHTFDPKCEGCKFLAASRALPGVLREG